MTVMTVSPLFNDFDFRYRSHRNSSRFTYEYPLFTFFPSFSTVVW